MKSLFKEFYKNYSYLELEELVEYFSILGGINIELDFFDDLDSMIEYNLKHNFKELESFIEPSYILESPYRNILISIAIGDGRISNVIKKSRLSKDVAESIIEELIKIDLITVEHSRENPLKQHPKHKLKKDLRSYKIEHKLRFKKPFFRFWFGYVEPYRNYILNEDLSSFFNNYEKHTDRLKSLVYEQLSNELLLQELENSHKILSSGSYWNIHSEFDVLVLTDKHKIYLGECKYKDRKICKNELRKLEAKAVQSSIKADVLVLFSKNGFSNELSSLSSKNLLLYELNDLEKLL